MGSLFFGEINQGSELIPESLLLEIIKFPYCLGQLNQDFFGHNKSILIDTNSYILLSIYYVSTAHSTITLPLGYILCIHCPI